MPARRFPAWAAPLIATPLVAYFAIQAALEGNGEVTLEWIIGGALVGFTVGCLIWLLDQPSVRFSFDSGKESATRSLQTQRGFVIPRFVALTSLLIFWVPYVGPAFALMALIMNRNHRGWWRGFSLVSLLASCITTIIAMILISLPR